MTEFLRRERTVFGAFAVSLFILSTPAAAQVALDRVQPEGHVPAEPEAPVKSTPPPIEVQAEPVENRTSGESILVGAVTLKGLQVLQPADFADVITPRLGQVIDDAGLRALAGAIAERARSRGFAFATAWIEPQHLSNGVLTVRVDEGRIDEVRLNGPDVRAVRAALAPLIDGAPVRLADVERRLLLAGDIDGVRIRNSRYIREKERGVLIVELARDTIAGSVALSNEGTRPLGPAQVRVEADVNGLLGDDDSLILTYTGTPLDPGELNFGYARYAKRVSANGTELTLTGSYSEAHPGAYLSDLELRSRSRYVAAGVLQPLWRRRSASLWLEGELGLRDLDQWESGAPVRADRLTVLRATLYGYANFAGGRLRGSVTVSQGLGILGATQSGDPLASRFDADGTFTTVYAWSDWTRSLGGPVSVRLAAQAQLATQPLLITEETSLGGTAFLRGYDWSERSGDEGISGLAELRYDWKQPFHLFANAQLYGFVDGGEVSNLGSNFGSGSLASTGGGVRADLGHSLGASFEVAVPLTGPRYDTGDEAPKINLRVGKSF
jgi:hemolysin activation/secretion protein